MSRVCLFLLVVLFAGNSALAQHYALKTVSGKRYAVTRKYDSKIDAELWNLISPYKSAVDSLMNSVVGHSHEGMKVCRPESPLSNWVADAMVEECFAAGFEVDMGLCNIGGLRADLPKGDVTVGDMMVIAPFENELCLLTFRGADLISLFEQIASVGGESVSAAVSLKVNADGKMESLRINGKKISRKQMYNVVTVDYLAEGNDGLTALKSAQRCVATGLLLHDALIANARRAQVRGKSVDCRTEGRIVYKDLEK